MFQTTDFFDISNDTKNFFTNYMKWYTQKNKLPYGNQDIPSDIINMMNNGNDYNTTENVCTRLYNQVQANELCKDEQISFFRNEFCSFFESFGNKEESVFAINDNGDVSYGEIIDAYIIDTDPDIKFMTEMCIDIWYGNFGEYLHINEDDHCHIGEDIVDTISYGPDRNNYINTIIDACREGPNTIVIALVNIVLDAYKHAVEKRNNVMMVDVDEYVWKNLYLPDGEDYKYCLCQECEDRRDYEAIYKENKCLWTNYREETDDEDDDDLIPIKIV